jgi:hypothetical protein
MKKSIYTFALLLIGAITMLSFTTSKENAEGEYLCIYAYDHENEKIAISNIFYSSEWVNGEGYLSDQTAGQYLENELDFDTDNYSNIIIYSHKQKNHVYDDRMDAITKAKKDGYSILKFNVKCKKAKLYSTY